VPRWCGAGFPLEHRFFTSKCITVGKLKCPLQVRWDLTPESTDGTGEANQSLWTQAYEKMMQIKKGVARRHNVNCEPPKYQVR
jgi:hypothetical protein